MDAGYELVKEQLFFRKELKERVYWFIHLRWIAVAVAFVGTWAASIFEPRFPLVPLHLILASIILYNTAFLLIWKQLHSREIQKVGWYTFFAHSQISLDLLALYTVVYFTGGIYSPLLGFGIFHIILAGILLSPISCFSYGVAVSIVLGILIAIGRTNLFPVLSQPLVTTFCLGHSDLYYILTAYVTFCAAIFISAYLITSVTLSLRTKGRDLLRVSKELDASNAKLTALYTMVQEMATCSDLQELMDSATRQGAHIFGVKACTVKLLDDQKKTLRFASTYGLSENYVAKSSIEIDKSPINKKIIEGSLHAIGKIDEKDYFQYPEDLRKEGISSMMCLPLKVEKINLGVFCVYSTQDHFFDKKDVQFFSLMTDLTAMAIENLKNDLDKSWFLQKAAHELRAPFNTVYSMLKTLRKEYLGEVNEKQKETIVRCERRIELLGDLINDLLKLGIRRREAGKVTFKLVDSAAVLCSHEALFKIQAGNKGITMTYTVENNMLPIMGEEKLLDELFTNLISNAVKYTPKGGNVTVRLESIIRDNKPWIRLAVSDTGIGIPQEDVARLFTEFFRAENAKNFSEEGTGLGLVIVKEIVDRLAGSITVSSAEGKGTTFTCLIPAAEPPTHRISTGSGS